jgi:hypothetical protein
MRKRRERYAKRDQGIVALLRGIHPRHVIWLLMISLFSLIAFVGKQYNTRLETLENYKKEQNGHLRRRSERHRVD